MVEISSLHHVAVCVTDIARSKNFYGNVLGLNEVPRPDFPFGGAWYQLADGRQLHLIVHERPRTLRGTTEIDLRDGHFAFGVADYEGAVERLRALGVECVLRPDNVTPWKQIYVTDPDGNVIELNAPREQAMAVIRVELEIAAAPVTCFDLARSVDAHVLSAGASSERAVAGVTTGLLGLGDEVTWRGRHFGIVQELTSRITAFDRPRHFRDEMVRGPFRRLVHDHYFDAAPAGTCMRDVFEFAAPLGLLGRLAERPALNEYLRRFLEERARVLKQLAESGDGKRFIGGA